MKLNPIYILPFLTLAVSPCRGQECKGVSIANSSIKVENVRVSNVDKQLTLSMTLNLDQLQMPTNNQFVLTPTISTADGDVAMPKIVVNGSRQHIMLQRDHRKRYAADTYIVKRVNGKPQQIEYLRSTTYDKRLANYKVLMSEDLCGCGDALANKSYELVEYRRPTAKLVRPKVVAEKIRELDKRAYIDFPVNRTELNPLYRRNPEQLDSIIRTINTLKEDNNLTVLAVNIHGFASPEGRFDNNDRLAKGRAQTLTQYVQRMVQLDEGIFTVSHTAEDWDGLRKFVAESNIEHKQQILDLANDTSLKEDEREAKIKAAYPDEYRFLLTACYPALRHSDYHIKYKVRPFNVEEAKALIHTRPQLLSQNEMYMVAQTYEPGSKEFGEIMEIAVRMFPDDPTANLNAACTRLNAGDAEGAKPYLDKAGDSEEAKAARKVYEEIK